MTEFIRSTPGASDDEPLLPSVRATRLGEVPLRTVVELPAAETAMLPVPADDMVLAESAPRHEKHRTKHLPMSFVDSMRAIAEVYHGDEIDGRLPREKAIEKHADIIAMLRDRIGEHLQYQGCSGIHLDQSEKLFGSTYRHKSVEDISLDFFRQTLRDILVVTPEDLQQAFGDERYVASARRLFGRDLSSTQRPTTLPQELRQYSVGLEQSRAEFHLLRGVVTMFEQKTGRPAVLSQPPVDKPSVASARSVKKKSASKQSYSAKKSASRVSAGELRRRDVDWQDVATTQNSIHERTTKLYYDIVSDMIGLSDREKRLLFARLFGSRAARDEQRRRQQDTLLARLADDFTRHQGEDVVLEQLASSQAPDHITVTARFLNGDLPRKIIQELSRQDGRIGTNHVTQAVIGTLGTVYSSSESQSPGV